MTATICICPPGQPPFDHLLESSPLCLAHRKDIQLVAAGWHREGGYWSRSQQIHPDDVTTSGRGYFLLTEDEAYDILLSEKE